MQDLKHHSHRRQAKLPKRKRSQPRLKRMGRQLMASPPKLLQPGTMKDAFRWPLLWNLFATDNPYELQSELRLLLLRGANVLLIGVCFWIGLSLLPAAQGFFEQSPQTLYISGNQLLTKEQVLTRTGLTPDSALSDLDPILLGQRLQQLPEVKTVEVRREFPNRLHLHLQEHEPVAILRTESRSFLVDRQHRLLQVRPANTLGWPILIGIPETGWQAGTRLNSLMLENGLRFLEALEAFPELKERVVATDLSDPTNVQLWIRKDNGQMTTARFGTDAFPERLKRFADVYHQVLEQHPTAQWLDLRFSDRILAGN